MLYVIRLSVASSKVMASGHSSLTSSPAVQEQPSKSTSVKKRSILPPSLMEAKNRIKKSTNNVKIPLLLPWVTRVPKPIRR